MAFWLTNRCVFLIPNQILTNVNKFGNGVGADDDDDGVAMAKLQKTRKVNHKHLWFIWHFDFKRNIFFPFSVLKMACFQLLSMKVQILKVKILLATIQRRFIFFGPFFFFYSGSKRKNTKITSETKTFILWVIDSTMLIIGLLWTKKKLFVFAFFLIIQQKMRTKIQ